MTVKERHYWKFIKQILFLLNYILFIIKICQMCKIKSHWMFSVVFFMFYICVICDCVYVLKYAIYLIWPRQFSFGPCFFNLAHTLARTKNEPEGTLWLLVVTMLWLMVLAICWLLVVTLLLVMVLCSYLLAASCYFVMADGSSYLLAASCYFGIEDGSA